MLSARVRMKRQKKANFCSMSMMPAGLKKLATIPVIRKIQMMLPGNADKPWNNLLELRYFQTELMSIVTHYIDLYSNVYSWSILVHQPRANFFRVCFCVPTTRFLYSLSVRAGRHKVWGSLFTGGRVML